MAKKSKKYDVVISISRGILEVEKIPSKISILVKDYDIQEENGNTKNDENGSYQPYIYDRR